MKFECPICKSTLTHERIDDGTTTSEISKDGEVKEVYSNSNGSDSVSCSNQSDHELPDDLVQSVIELVACQ